MTQYSTKQTRKGFDKKYSRGLYTFPSSKSTTLSKFTEVWQFSNRVFSNTRPVSCSDDMASQEGQNVNEIQVNYTSQTCL